MNIIMNSTIKRKAPPTVSFYDRHICCSSFFLHLFAARTFSGGGVSGLSVKTSNLCFIMHYKDVTDLSLWFVPLIPHDQMKENNPSLLEDICLHPSWTHSSIFWQQEAVFMGVCYVTAESVSQTHVWSSSFWECGGVTGYCVQQGTWRGTPTVMMHHLPSSHGLYTHAISSVYGD